MRVLLRLASAVANQVSTNLLGYPWLCTHTNKKEKSFSSVVGLPVCILPCSHTINLLHSLPNSFFQSDGNMVEAKNIFELSPLTAFSKLDHNQWLIQCPN